MSVSARSEPLELTRSAVAHAVPIAVPIAVLVAAVSRLPYLRAPLSSDEAGFLMVGGQWQPGSSLYGDYWVDRPPGLITLFSLADLAGGTVALRLLGLLCATVSVALSAGIARRLSPGGAAGTAAALAAVVSAALLSSPLVDSRVVNGELLALPWVLGGILAALRAADHTTSPSRWAVWGWSVLAGTAGLAAVSVKQNFAEVALVVVVLAAVLCRRSRVGHAALLLAGALTGAVAMAGLLLSVSASRGTDLGGLWDAVIAFRFDASAVIAAHATDATTARAGRLALVYALTGAPAVLLGGIWWIRDRDRAAGDVGPAPLPMWAALLVAGAEVLSLASGGSYWLHYLVQVVPGLVLVVGCSARQAGNSVGHRRRPAGVVARAAVALVVVSAVLSYALAAARPPGQPDGVAAVVSFLRANAHGRPRTAVVAFGMPVLLREAGMTSPYPDLWSLPVRVRDPQLNGLTAVLRGPQAPTWIVVAGAGLSTWGVDATAAERVARRRYHEVWATSAWTVLERRA